LGAVIAQDNRPIGFFSRKLSETQQKNSVTETELLAIVETLKEFKRMLWGQDIKVYTDHKSLTRDALGLTSNRVYCWWLLLEDIRSAKQDDVYGASNILLPCPGSMVIFHLVKDVAIILKSSI
jgi:hypothetical protein